MAKTLIFRNAPTTGLASIVGSQAELFVDTTLKTVVVMDGVTSGGTTLARNADVQTLSSVTATNLATLSSVAATKATSSTFGIVRADGTSVLITSGVISIQAFFTGMIMMWSGSIATIPSGWALCNGSNGTPDLRNKFIVGAGSTYNPADTGGTSDTIVVSHSHTITDPGHFHYWGGGGNAQVGNDNGGANANGGSTAFATSTVPTGITGTNTTGQSGTNQNLPPYYALAYIMKT